MDRNPLLAVDDLKVHFPVGGGLIRRAGAAVRAVDGVSFSVPRGTTFGIVGESGSGKTTTALAVMRLVQHTGGQIRLGGSDIGNAAGETLRRERRRFQMVFQDPFASLNPRRRVGDAVRDALDLMQVGEPRGRAARVRELLAAVGLRPEQHALFPHQFSGGQRQRIVLARALAAHPELLVCDEPVSALDVAIQAQILNLMQRLQRERPHPPVRAAAASVHPGAVVGRAELRPAPARPRPAHPADGRPAQPAVGAARLPLRRPLPRRRAGLQRGRAAAHRGEPGPLGALPARARRGRRASAGDHALTGTAGGRVARLARAGRPHPPRRLISSIWPFSVQ